MNDEQFKTLSKQLDAVLTPIKALAIVELVREFYPRAEEREKLIAEYQALQLADREAYDAMDRAHKELKELSPTTSSFEDRVRQFGEEEAHRQYLPVGAAVKRKTEASDALVAFEKRHRLIVRMLDAKGALGKHRYED